MASHHGLIVDVERRRRLQSLVLKSGRLRQGEEGLLRGDILGDIKSLFSHGR
jgi:hypothetical protein